MTALYKCCMLFGPTIVLAACPMDRGEIMKDWLCSLRIVLYLQYHK